MKIILDNKIICSLFPFLVKKGKGTEMGKIRVEVVGRRLTYAATNGCILGIFSRDLDKTETAEKDFSVCVPVQLVGKVSAFRKGLIMLTSDDLENFKLIVGVCEFSFERETCQFPNFKQILLSPDNRQPLKTYRVFNPAYLAAVADFMGAGYYKTPYVLENKKKATPVQFEAENCGQEWTALIMPMRA